jgi:hypothetical protein
MNSLISGTPASVTITSPNWSMAGGVLNVTSVSGVIIDNMLVVGTGIPFGTTITGNITGTGGIGTYAVSSTVTASTGTINLSSANVAFPTTYNPINVYSFAIQPEEHQPSGTCNFSRIDTSTLVFDSIKTGAYPTKATPFNFRIYAVNYNIFRVMSGMGGLAYSN